MDAISGKPKNGFWHSNLFIFLLGQAFAFLCWLIVLAFAWGKYSEKFTAFEMRVGIIETKATRADERAATVANVQEQETKEVGVFKSRLTRMEQDTAHFDVMEAEHLRLTKDVENLKNGKK